MVIGNVRRNIPLVEARDEDGTVITSAAGRDMVGAGVAPFELVFPEAWFFDSEVILGDFNEYPIRILGDGRTEGANTVYTVELMGGAVKGMPKELLMPGKRFSYEYAPVEEELSRKAGGVRFSAPVAMRNEFSKIRIHDKVSGALNGRKIAFGIPAVKAGEDGKQMPVTGGAWMTVEEWQLEQTWQEYKNNILAFGRSNRDQHGRYMNFGKSGEVIKMGNGLYAQMEVANTFYYNDFSLKLLENLLYDMCAGKIDFQKRKFVLTTGEVGAMLFNKAVLDTVSGWTLFNMNGDRLGVLSQVQSPIHSNALKAGYQFVEYVAPNNIHLTLNVDPTYDDPVRNKITDKDGRPAMSKRFDIFDMGTEDQPNIFKVGVKGQEGDFRSYQWGLAA